MFSNRRLFGEFFPVSMILFPFKKISTWIFKWKWQLLSRVAPWTVACQAPLSVGFSGNSIGVGSHSLLQGIFPTQGSTSVSLWTIVHGIFLARIVEWVAISSSRGDLPNPEIQPASPVSSALQVAQQLRIQYSCWENPTDRILVGYGPWGCKNLDATEATEYARFYMQVKINNGSDG